MHIWTICICPTSFVHLDNIKICVSVRQAMCIWRIAPTIYAYIGKCYRQSYAYLENITHHVFDKFIYKHSTGQKLLQLLSLLSWDLQDHQQRSGYTAPEGSEILIPI